MSIALNRFEDDLLLEQRSTDQERAIVACEYPCRRGRVARAQRGLAKAVYNARQEWGPAGACLGSRSSRWWLDEAVAR